MSQLALIPNAVDLARGVVTTPEVDEARDRFPGAQVTLYCEQVRALVGALPAIRAFVVDGAHLVVDGWHRVKAHTRAERATIPVELREGTRRDALLAAVKAKRAKPVDSLT